MPKRNVGYGVYSQRLRIFMKSQNLWDFASNKKNKKQNKKIWLRAVPLRELHSRSHTTLSLTVGNKLKIK